MGSTMQLLLTLLTVGSLWLVDSAVSPEELALRKAILSRGPGSVVLKRSVVLTADLPELSDNKTLKVFGRCGKRGRGKCTISGGYMYRHFSNSMAAPVSLVLDNLIITATKKAEAAVAIGGEGSSLTVNKCKFIANPRALMLYIVNAIITKTDFSQHTGNAVYTASEEGLGDDVKFASCRFLGNKAAAGQGGGAIFVGKYASVTVDKCRFVGNSADYRGGALRIFNGYGVVTRSAFIKNTATEAGGAITVYNGGLKASVCSFVENVALTGAGGAVRVGSEDTVGASTSFDRCSFTSNKAPKGFGGAFQLDTDSSIALCKSNLTANTGKGGVISNGYIVGVGNTISTRPPATILAVTLEKDAVVTYDHSKCT